jgi:hypothetical protein
MAAAARKRSGAEVIRQLRAAYTNDRYLGPSCGGLTLASIKKRALFVKAMDCRVKPGNDLGRVNVNDHWY